MYSCTKCDAQATKWAGRCDVCDSWGTMVEEETSLKTNSAKGRSASGGKKAAPQKSARLLDLQKEADRPRLATGDPEVDRVLGGGITQGSLVLLSGEPGIGKSTLVAALASGSGKETLYISGEESASQLADRFKRLKAKIDQISLLEPFPIESLISTIEKESPELVIIDSVQTLTSSELDSVSGTPGMVRYATSLLIELAKRTNVSILLVGQVTKDGNLAGPKTLEHLVDVVLHIQGDPVHAYRLLRASKNRFGSTDEIGVFEMTAEGLKAVENPSAKFLEERTNVPGSVITATVEGSRVFLVEVQALVEKTSYGMPVRRASGFDHNRLQMLTAILSKRAGLKLSDQDVYVNVIGGLELKEPAADLAICAAIISALNNQALEPTLFVGEVGLGGEVRSVPFLERRLNEAKRLGIEKTVTPKTIKQIKELG
ncbi:DNA repair protein RadA [Patescibacteria group bacterium]